MMILKETKKLVQKYHHSYRVERYWTYLVCAFLLLFAVALLYSSWLFTATTTLLDEPALATFESNSTKLRAIEKSVSASEEAIRVRTRTGDGDTSQKAPEVIE